MVDRIRRYKRYRDYYAINCFEVQSAVFCTVVISYFLLNVLNLYGSFQTYQNDIKQIVSSVVGGEFSLLGMSLAGMAIITSIFSQDTLRIINMIDKNDTINRVLSQFEFFALNLAFQIIYLIMLYLVIASDKGVIAKTKFVLILVGIIYHFCFILFYIISLIENCIRVNELKNVCNKITTVEKSNIDIANELRIDYLLALVLKEHSIDKEKMLDVLFDMIDKSNLQQNQDIKKYLRDYYRK